MTENETQRNWPPQICEDFDDIVRSAAAQDREVTSPTSPHMTELTDAAAACGPSYHLSRIQSEATTLHGSSVIEYCEEDWRNKTVRANGRGRAVAMSMDGNIPNFAPFSVEHKTNERTALLSLQEPATHTTAAIYCWELCRDFTKSTIRGKQSRLTVGELLEHFDFLNDFIFICRVAGTIFVSSAKGHYSPGAAINGKIAIVWLISIWCTSLVAYATRRHFIYHRIDGEHTKLFIPFAVFCKIRDVGESRADVLCMFEKLFWTYQLVMRLVEDIPQVLCSALFLSTFGSDIYTYFMISYSCLLLLLTSWRMGVMYPILGTFSLILSRQPPVDSPLMTEAASTTKSFAIFMLFTSFVWTTSSLICLTFTEGLWLLTFTVFAIISGAFGLFFISYWGYLERQATNEGDAQPNEFLETFARMSSPRL